MMMANPMAGMTGIDQAWVMNQPELSDSVRASAVSAENTDQPFIELSSSSETLRRFRYIEQHDGQTDTDLGGGHGDDVQAEYLTVHAPCLRENATKLSTHRVQDEFDAHQHQDGVAARDHAVDAEAEQHGAQQQEFVDEHVSSPQSLLASTMAPTRAANSTNDSAQNGSR